jgi:hypothetical protein
MNSRIIGISNLCCVLLGVFPVVVDAQGNLIQNGDFQTGDLSDWTVLTTLNGTLGSEFGLPNVLSFDVAGTGNASNAAQFQAGEVSFFGATPAGGAIYQTFNCSVGLYNISAAAAAYLPNNRANNADAGLFTLLLDGSTITNHQFYAIAYGETLRATLQATVSLSQGPHQIAIEITRPFTIGSVYGETPVGFLDNIQVEAIPEPSALSLLGICILFLCWHLKRPNFGSGECAGRVSVGIRSPWRRIAECFRCC